MYGERPNSAATSLDETDVRCGSGMVGVSLGDGVETLELAGDGEVRLDPAGARGVELVGDEGGEAAGTGDAAGEIGAVELRQDDDAHLLVRHRAEPARRGEAKLHEDAIGRAAEQRRGFRGELHRPPSCCRFISSRTARAWGTMYGQICRNWLRTCSATTLGSASGFIIAMIFATSPISV